MIPVENIYYLLCYAWDKLTQKDLVPAGTAGKKDIYTLLLSVLLKELPHLTHKGYWTDYLSQEQMVQGVKGKLQLSKSLKTLSFSQGYAQCQFQHFTDDTLPNRILRSSITRLLGVKTLSDDLHKSLRNVLYKMPAFSPISLHQQVIQQALESCYRKPHYLFLLHICELLYSQSMLTERGDEVLFKDFERDERKMALLFEAFVRNFYKIELPQVRVFRENLHWQMKGEALNYLPTMQTDISLQWPSGRKVIIDTKFYSQTLSLYYQTQKIHAENLYQLFAYLKNQKNPEAEGILLYPTVTQSLALQYQYEGHRIAVRTLNLAQPWHKIHEDLLEIVSIFE